MLKPVPVIFFGHGSSMNALSDNAFTQKWTEIGKILTDSKVGGCLIVLNQFLITFIK